MFPSHFCIVFTSLWLWINVRAVLNSSLIVVARFVWVSATVWSDTSKQASGSSENNVTFVGAPFLGASYFEFLYLILGVLHFRAFISSPETFAALYLKFVSYYCFSIRCISIFSLYQLSWIQAEIRRYWHSANPRHPASASFSTWAFYFVHWIRRK